MNFSLKSLHERIELKSSVSEEVELRVTISAYDRLAKEIIQEEICFLPTRIMAPRMRQPTPPKYLGFNNTFDSG